MRVCVCSSFLLLCLSLMPVTAATPEIAPGTEGDYEKLVAPFLEQNCYQCHDADKAKAGLRIDSLSRQFVSEPAEEWLEIMDAINLGDMPPEDEPRPDAAQSFEVVKWIAAQLTHSEKAAREAGGQVPMRRLNRDEFTNTLRDLLHLDEQVLDIITQELPGDGKAEGFDRLGAALYFDQTQMQRTIAAAEQIAALTILTPEQLAEPPSHTQRFEAEAIRERWSLGIREEEEMIRSRVANDKDVKVLAGPPKHLFGEDGVTFKMGGDVYLRDFPWGRIGQASLDELITEDGYYRFRIRAGAEKGTRGEPIQLTLAYNFKTPQEITTTVDLPHDLDQPGVVEVVMFIPRGAEDQRRRLTLMYNHLPDYIKGTKESAELFQATVGNVGKIQKARAAGDLEEVARLEVLLEDGKKRALAWKGPAREIKEEYRKDTPPTVFLDYLEIEGPLQENWPPLSHQSLLSEGDERQDLAYARDIITKLLPRAYRRPVTEGEIDRVVSVIGAELSAGTQFHEALRMGLARVMSSPGFLFLQEPSADGSRQLTDYELASRLSYFLWSTMPDQELFDLAAAGKLSQPRVLAAQVERMMADEKAGEFVENFAGQWLNIREFGSVQPDENYREYDKDLEEASQLEAYAFFREVFTNNLPITCFLDSDFVMINERLAQHYEIPNVTGEEIRRVALRPEDQRGGIFGMAGLMTYLADGTRTLPVRRAAWIAENLFNDPPPPPPPNAGEVQPNTEGENLTVRERLELHRDEPTCASCHATLDPYGLALENYDAIGKWRTRQNGEGFKGKNTPELVISGELPSGIAYDSLAGFKDALLQEKDRFARAFIERLMTYALGRPVGYSDRETVEALLTHLQANDYRIQSVIHELAASEVFQTK